MLQLGQLHLQFTFVTSCSLGKNIQNQSGTIKHPALQMSLQVSFLAGRQSMVEYHQLGIVVCHRISDFLQFAATDRCLG